MGASQNDPSDEYKITLSEKESGNSSCHLSTVMDRLEIQGGKNENFFIASTDVEPLDVVDLFHRYDKTVKRMVVLDEDRLARTHSLSMVTQGQAGEGYDSKFQQLHDTSNNLPIETKPHLQHKRSFFVGSIVLNSSMSASMTPSQKARIRDTII
jgi:hypothetical protein